MTKIVQLFPPAKLNLTLAIQGKRADGLHAIRSFVAPIDWRDTLTIRQASNISLRVQGANKNISIQNNLVMRAAFVLQKYVQQHFSDKAPFGAHIELCKTIPIGAGLGGGSSDAAATLLGLNTLWQTNVGIRTLCHLGFTLGADVPFFLIGQSAYVQGAGENIQPMTLSQYCTTTTHKQLSKNLPYNNCNNPKKIVKNTNLWAVVITPAFACDTKTVYHAYAQNASLASKNTKKKTKDTKYTPLSPLFELTKKCSRIPLPISLVSANDLAQVIADCYPQFAFVVQQLEKHLGQRWFVSGSGSSVFCLCKNQAQASTLCDQAKNMQKLLHFRAVRVVRVLTHANIFGV